MTRATRVGAPQAGALASGTLTLAVAICAVASATLLVMEPPPGTVAVAAPGLAVDCGRDPPSRGVS